MLNDKTNSHEKLIDKSEKLFNVSDINYTSVKLIVGSGQISAKAAIYASF